MVKPGFSLVEVIVAMVLLSVGLLGVAGSGLLAAELLREAEVREDMLNRASSLLDSLLANEVTGAGMLPLARYRIDWTATAEHVEVVARLPNHSDFTLRAAR
jgi:prepilin-type N-terminal cleavage/methylation domain-containing protein